MHCKTCSLSSDATCSSSSAEWGEGVERGGEGGRVERWRGWRGRRKREHPRVKDALSHFIQPRTQAPKGKSEHCRVEVARSL